MASVFKRRADRKKKNAKWVISWFDAERSRWRQHVGYPDKELSLAKGIRLERESAEHHEGLTCRVRDESVKPIVEHLGAYVNHLRAKERDSTYVEQLERRIRRVIESIGAKRLADIDPSKVEQALMTMACGRGFEKAKRRLSHTTRNEYSTSLKGFTAWAYKRRLIDHDPLSGLAKVDEKSIERVHPRRALTAAEVASMLDAAERRPEIEVRTVRRGPNKGKLLAKVREPILVRERLKGVHRRMAYMLAIWTGLRRSELEQLSWDDVLLEVLVPHIQLRACTTKAGRADVIPLHPQMVEELRAYRPALPEPNQRVLPEVPDMDVLKKDLALAGIEYGDDLIGYADLHAQRKTLNMLMATHGVGMRVRQAHLRHTDPRLTEGTYFDVSLFLQPHADELGQVPPIALRSTSLPEPAAETTCAEKAAQLVHETGGSAGQNEATTGNQEVVTEERISITQDAEGATQVTEVTWDGTNGQGPASCDTGPLEKRAKGVEPSTFTLAT